MTIAEIKDALGKDFLNRDNKSFVHARTEGRLGWEKFAEGEGLASFATDIHTQKEALKEAYRLASDMIAVMDPPFKVKIRINPGEESCTDSQTVWVGTKHFDDASETLGRKIDIFTGLAIHEGCHLLHTDFSVGKDEKSPLLHALHNLIEDERIEHILGDDTPGLSNFIRETKYYFFDKYVREHADEMASKDRNTRLLSSVISLVRFPERILSDEAVLEEFGETLVKVRGCLEPWPDSTQAALETAKRIYDVLVEDIKKNGGKEGKGGDSSDSSDGKSSSEEKSKDGTGKESSKRSSSKSDSENDSKDEPKDASASSSSEKEEGSEETGSSEGEGVSGESGEGSDSGEARGEKGKETAAGPGSGDEGEKEPLTEEEAKALLEELAEMAEEMTETPSGKEGSDKCAAVRKNGSLVESLCSGELEETPDEKTFIKAIKDKDLNEVDNRRFDASLHRVRKYIPAVQRVLRANSTEYRYSLRGMRSGRLDASKLAEAIQGVDTVFIRQGEVKSDKIAVCLLVDESGSMSASCCRDEEGNSLSRIDVARDTAVLIDQAMSKVPNVELFVYGHAADDIQTKTTELYIYRDKRVRGRKTLGACIDKWNNADGYAILEAAKRVRQQTQAPCLFFVISDGQPAALIYDSIDGVEHTRKAVEEISKDGFIPVQIAISACVDPSMMFRNYVTYTDLKSLAPELGKMVRKAVLEHSKRHSFED